MARRSGQNGYIELRNGVYFARFRIDVPGRTKRVSKRIRICPVEGPGSLNASERARRLKQILEEYGANSEAHLREVQAANLGTTLEQQSEFWLHQLENRKRKPVKPRTLETVKGYLKYINSRIGEMQLADVNNRTMRVFVAEMALEKKAGNPRFSPKSITSYLATVKSVVKSALDDRGEPVYNVKWNHEYIDLPVVEDQNTPSFTANEINAILAQAEGRDRILYALLAASGLRIGEAFALRVEDFYDNVIRVKSSTWEGEHSTPKTVSGAREVDLHSTLAEALREHIGSRTEGFIFPSDTGTPLRKSNLLRRSLHPILKEIGRSPCGFHAFRRFRVAYLRKQMVPEILVRIWVGHSTDGVTDRYALEGVKRDTLFRTMAAQKAGLGFKMPDLHPVAPTIDSAKSFRNGRGERI